MSDDLRRVVASVEREMRYQSALRSRDELDRTRSGLAAQMLLWADQLRGALAAEHVHVCISKAPHEEPCVCSCGKEMRGGLTDDRR